MTIGVMCCHSVLYCGLQLRLCHAMRCGVCQDLQRQYHVCICCSYDKTILLRSG